MILRMFIRFNISTIELEISAALAIALGAVKL